MIKEFCRTPHIYQQNILKENENKKADETDDKNKKTDNWFNKTLELAEKAQPIEQKLEQLRISRLI